MEVSSLDYNIPVITRDRSSQMTGIPPSSNVPGSARCSMVNTNDDMDEDFVMHNFWVFESDKYVFVTGGDSRGIRWRVLTIDRVKSMNELHASEHKLILSSFSEAVEYVRKVAGGGTIPHGKRIEAILGFIRFFDSVAMVVVTGKEKVAMVGGHPVHTVTGHELIDVTVNKIKSKSVLHKYRSLFQSVDLTSDFYFSRRYDITNTLQYNTKRFTTVHTNGVDWRYNERFLWNYYLTQEFLRKMPRLSKWFVPLIHGFVTQRRVIIGSRDVSIALIARRSRHFAGTRFNRRGIGRHGDVANEVESEQIVHDSSAWSLSHGGFSSFVMIRGSIPLFWSQDNPLSLRPEIVVHKVDQQKSITRKHFQQLFERYGSPIILFSLIKKDERSVRESRLGQEFLSTVVQLATTFKKPKRLLYLTYDFLGEKKRGADVTKHVSKITSSQVADCGVFLQSHNRNSLHNPTTKFHYLYQRGILRINCVDCLDRTNVAEYCAGKAALRLQLQGLSIIDRDELYSELIDVLQEMFTEQGDRISRQYGGSGAMHKDVLAGDQASKDLLQQHQKTSSSAWSGLKANAIASIRRYYNNNFTDSDKQNSINVFLGNFIPSTSKTHVWDVDPIVEHSDVDRCYRCETSVFQLTAPYQDCRPATIFPVNTNTQQVERLVEDKDGMSYDDDFVTESGITGISYETYMFERYNPRKFDSLDDILKSQWGRPVVVRMRDLNNNSRLVLESGRRSSKLSSMMNTKQSSLRVLKRMNSIKMKELSAVNECDEEDIVFVDVEGGETHTPPPVMLDSTFQGSRPRLLSRSAHNSPVGSSSNLTTKDDYEIDGSVMIRQDSELMLDRFPSADRLVEYSPTAETNVKKLENEWTTPVLKGAVAPGVLQEVGSDERMYAAYVNVDTKGLSLAQSQLDSMSDLGLSVGHDTDLQVRALADELADVRRQLQRTQNSLNQLLAVKSM